MAGAAAPDPVERAESDRPSSAAGIGIPPPPRSGVAAWLPGVWVLRHYRRAWLHRDIAAGIALSAMLVPSGMGYAEASGLPPVTGLYATVVPLIAYALFGPSRIMVLGPDSALAAVIAAAVVGSGHADPGRAVALASLLAIMTGLLCIGAGMAKAGFVTDLLSKPVRVGYMNGIALTILVGQTPKLLGFSVEAAGFVGGVSGLVRGLVEGRTNVFAAALGAGALALILGLRAVRPKAPGVLVAVVLATAAVTWLGDGRSLPVVGPVPHGVPSPALPDVTFTDVANVLVASLGIALVSFADTSVLSRTFAGRHGYRVDPNRELVAIGLASFAAGFFRGFPISSSSSRTPVAEAAGAKTQVTGLVGALAIVILLVASPQLLQNLPMAALAAIVIAAALRLFDVGSLRSFYVVRRADFVLSVVAFIAVVALGVIQGIALAVGLSLLDFVRRAWRPHDAILGRAHGVKGYHDIRRYPGARQIPGLLLFRWDAPLFFANAEMFRARIIDAVDAAAQPVRWVIVAAEPITDVDTTAAEVLEELDVELAARGTELAFAEMKDPVKDRLHRYGLEATIGSDFLFPTLGVAVKTFLERHDVAWVDWEEGPPRPES